MYKFIHFIKVTKIELPSNGLVTLSSLDETTTYMYVIFSSHCFYYYTKTYTIKTRPIRSLPAWFFSTFYMMLEKQGILSFSWYPKYWIWYTHVSHLFSSWVGIHITHWQFGINTILQNINFTKHENTFANMYISHIWNAFIFVLYSLQDVPAHMPQHQKCLNWKGEQKTIIPFESICISKFY